MKKFFLNNYRIKVVAVLLATGLWWFVYSGHHPRTSAPVSVKIQYEHLAPQYKLVSPREYIRVELSGDSQSLADISPENLKARVDLTGLIEGRHLVLVNIVNRTGARIVRGSGPVQVEIKRLNMIELPVKLKFFGTLPAGFELGRVTFRPETASVYGDEEELSRVSELVASIDLDGRTGNFKIVTKFKAEDSVGRAVAGANVAPPSVTIDVTIRSIHSRTVPIIPRYKPGSSYKGMAEANFFPTAVTLIGNEAILRSTGSVESEEFDLSLCREGGVFPLSLKLPKNVSSNASQVTFTCEPPSRIPRSFLVSLRPENLCGGCRAALDPNEIEVVAEGAAGVVNSISITDITASVDLKDMEPGKYSISPNVSLNEAIINVDLGQTAGEIKVTITK